VSNPESRRYRFSVGDELLFTSPLFDHKGGTKVGKLYGDFKVVAGKSFASLIVQGEVVYVVSATGDEIVAKGVASLSKDARVAVVGGTGAYNGARGTLTSHNNADDSSVDTITLLP
jgi:subtilisin family serine protease